MMYKIMNPRKQKDQMFKRHIKRARRYRSTSSPRTTQNIQDWVDDYEKYYF